MLFLRLFKESILFALHALNVNKLRTFLSLLGISIGIFAIIAVFTVVDALESNIQKDVESLGSNVIYIQKWPWSFGNDYPWWKYWQRPLPGLKEMDELKHRTNLADAFVYMGFVNGRTVKYRNNFVENAGLGFVSHDYYRLYTIEFESGRYFSEMESSSGKAVCVIGNNFRNGLFPGEEPVGKQISVMGRKLTVVGLIKKEGSSLLGNNHDDMILMPVNYARNIVDLRSDRISPFIGVKGASGVSNNELKNELEGAMRAVRRLRPTEEENFALNESSLLSQGISQMFRVISFAGWIIGGFSILVGGFGIANIMFVSVKERTNQIGIQKSLGAKKYFILQQFLFEAIFLSVLGGIIGLLLLFPLTLIATNMTGFDMPLTTANIILGLSVSAIIGIISGFLPALTAARLDPVEAIRAN